MFSGWESVGGVQRRITLTVPDTRADGADSACEVAKREVEEALAGSRAANRQSLAA
jgi:hypothetical protein